MEDVGGDTPSMIADCNQEGRCAVNLSLDRRMKTQDLDTVALAGTGPSPGTGGQKRSRQRVTDGHGHGDTNEREY